MKCPHCPISFSEKSEKIEKGSFYLGGDKKTGHWGVGSYRCPECEEFILFLQKGAGCVSGPDGERLGIYPVTQQWLVHPKSAVMPLPKEVPKEYTSDFNEACAVLQDSPKASAALSRRCLQHLLREKGGVKHSDLAKEIQEVIDSGKLPSYLATAVDGVRTIGNFGAHPIKSTNTGKIIDVEPGEAEWLLDTLEGLFDFYFVQPSILQQKRDALNQKLREAGKPPMK